MKTIALNNKKLLLVVTFLCTIFFGFSQSVLNAGDIVITGYRSDYPDEFTFVLLTDVQATTQIKFTDNGWQSSGSFRTGEGILVWTATSDIPCGTEINVAYDNPIFVASEGTITDDDNFGLGTRDQILAYQGIDVAPTFIYAIHFSNTTWTNSTNDQSTALPPGLINGTHAVYLNNWQNGNYDCSVTTDPIQILSAVSTSSNWIMSNDPLVLGGCIYGCYSCAITTTWDGSNWDNGIPDNSTEVIIDDVYDTGLHMPGNINACSLTVTTNGSLRVANGDYVSVENDIVIDGTFSVEYEGSVVQIDDNANVIGSATVRKQTAPMGRFYEYTYWSSPVTGETIGNGLTDSDPGRRFRFEAGNFKDSTQETNNNGATDPGQDDIDDDGDDWQFVTAATIMNPGVGYASHHEESFFIGPGAPPYQFIYTFDGPFNNGEVVVPVVRNNNEPPEEFNDINWNLIGNPYPSAIDIDLFFTENNYDATTNPDGTLTGAIYLWSQNEPPSGTNNGNENQNFVSSDYAIINRIGEVPPADNEIAGGDNLLPARFIPSGQGFFVAYSDVRPTATGDVIFNNSMRVTGNNDQFFRMNSQQDNTFALKLTTNSGVFNQMLVGYVEGATNLKDEMYFDAPRNLSTGSSAIIYSIIEDSPRKFAIQGRDINSLNANDVIPIGVKNTINTNTQFTISVADLEGEFMHSNAIYLRDNLLGIEHNLSDSGYTFDLEEGEYNSRFEIFYSGTLSVDEFNLESNELIISKLDDNKFGITTSDHSQITNIKMYDLIGRELMDIEGNNNTLFTLNTSSLSNSVFILHVTTAERKKLTKKFLNK